MQQNSLISISTFTALHTINKKKSMDLLIAQKSKLLGQMNCQARLERVPVELRKVLFCPVIS